MNMTAVLQATLIVGLIGLIVGVLLSILGKLLAVHVDEREEAVRAALPGSNCGACGYAGCDACAKAIAAGEAPVAACPVGGAPVAETIATIMGQEKPVLAVRQVAFVHCSGSRTAAPVAAEYTGPADCHAAKIAGGAGRSCSFGCYGLGTCEKACPFDAVHVTNGLAKVDAEKCRSCGRCVAACPQKLISLEPADAVAEEVCSSHQKGKAVMQVCQAGCIACGACARVCPHAAITLVDNLPVIDQSLCQRCGACVAKCPRKVIHL